MSYRAGPKLGYGRAHPARMHPLRALPAQPHARGLQTATRHDATAAGNTADGSPSLVPRNPHPGQQLRRDQCESIQRSARSRKRVTGSRPHDRHDPTRHAPPRYRLEPPAGTHDGPAGSPATVDFRAAAGEWARKHQKYLFSGNGTGNNCLFDCVGMAFNGSRKSSFNERVRELCQLVINTIAEAPAHLGEACHLSTGISISGAS